MKDKLPELMYDHEITPDFRITAGIIPACDSVEIAVYFQANGEAGHCLRVDLKEFEKEVMMKGWKKALLGLTVEHLTSIFVELPTPSVNERVKEAREAQKCVFEAMRKINR